MIKIVKLSMAYIVLALNCLLGLFLTIFKPFDPYLIGLVARCSGKIGNFILGIKVQIIGVENFECSSPAIIISNHQENIDVFVICQNFPRRTVTMGKDILKWIPFFGQFYWLSGNILINRSNKRKSFQSINMAAKKVRQKMVSVWMMPEGTRNKGLGLKEFKKGAFHLAVQGQLPIIPVSISSYHKFNDLNKLLSGDVLIKVHKPILTKGKTKADINDLLVHAREVISNGIEELDLILSR